MSWRDLNKTPYLFSWALFTFFVYGFRGYLNIIYESYSQTSFSYRGSYFKLGGSGFADFVDSLRGWLFCSFPQATKQLGHSLAHEMH